jgi:hypothetical protein
MINKLDTQWLSVMTRFENVDDEGPVLNATTTWKIQEHVSDPLSFALPTILIYHSILLSDPGDPPLRGESGITKMAFASRLCRIATRSTAAIRTMVTPHSEVIQMKPWNWNRCCCIGPRFPQGFDKFASALCFR